MTSDDAPHRVGEKDIETRSTPNKDLASALVIGLLAVVTMIASLRLDMPGSIYTAPGILPFITAGGLLAMALILGARAVRSGATLDRGGLIGGPVRSAARCWSRAEDRRTLMLATIVTLYVLLVAFIRFDIRIPTPLFEIQITSYEVISIIVVTWILRLFWRARLSSALLVTLTTVEALASIFRYGFGILMPESF